MMTKLLSDYFIDVETKIYKYHYFVETLNLRSLSIYVSISSMHPEGWKLYISIVLVSNSSKLEALTTMYFFKHLGQKTFTFLMVFRQ